MESRIPFYEPKEEWMLAEELLKLCDKFQEEYKITSLNMVRILVRVESVYNHRWNIKEWKQSLNQKE